MSGSDSCNVAKVERYKTLIAEHPSSAELWLDYARFLHNEKCGTSEETIEALVKAAGFYQDIDFRLRIGDSLIDAGRIKEGLYAMYKYLKDHPTAFAYRILGRDLINVSKYRRARKILRKALIADPRNAETFFLTARLIEPNSKQRAVPYYRKAIELDPHYQEAWRELGWKLTAVERTRAEGIASLKRAAELDPKDVWSHLGLALGFRFVGQLENAEKHYEIAAALRPGDEYINELYERFKEEHGRSERTGVGAPFSC